MSVPQKNQNSSKKIEYLNEQQNNKHLKKKKKFSLHKHILEFFSSWLLIIGSFFITCLTQNKLGIVC